jgi:hypothetical protein
MTNYSGYPCIETMGFASLGVGVFVLMERMVPVYDVLKSLR